jgi:CBS domain-containing protein
VSDLDVVPGISVVSDQPNAGERVEHIWEISRPLSADGLVQPIVEPVAQSPEERLLDIARSLSAGGSAPTLTVRAFLSWFWGSQRRGRWIVSYIRGCLRKANLSTVPDFESAYLDSNISFKFVPLQVEPSPTPNPEITEEADISDNLVIVPGGPIFADPTYRISKLASANRKPLFVKPDSVLEEAVTLMLANDFSQLAVMLNDRDVKGVISWESIGTRLCLGQKLQWVREAMSNHAEVSSEASLFTAIPIIVEHGYALVRSSLDKRVVGIITTSDLSLQFQQLSEPFLLLGEIENHLRKIIGPNFEPQELASVRDPSDSARLINSVSDLSFGEYKRLIEDPTKWQKLRLNLDRAVFVELVEKVRQTRNDVMHFDPDGIEEKALTELRDFARLLRVLQTVGAT